MKNLFDVSGKIVLVTGGSRGIGKMIAQGFVENGAKVYVSSRKAVACEETAAELSRKGECVPLPADAANAVGWEAIAHRIEADYGHLDVLVNNAGAAWGAPVEEYPEIGWDKVYDINVRGVFFLIQKLLPALRKSAKPPARVINIASINGIKPPDLETFAYSSSKAACIMLTRHLAKRLAAERILVNAIAPGPFATDMMAATLDTYGAEYVARNPLRRLGNASDIAGTALFMASAASSYMTGAVIPCDGGVSQI